MPANDAKNLGCQSQSGSGHYLTLVETSEEPGQFQEVSLTMGFQCGAQWSLLTTWAQIEFCLIILWPCA